MTVVVDTSGHIYDDFSRLLFLHPHREASALTNELRTTEESDQVRFLRAASLTNLKGVDFGENFGMRISITLDLSSRSLYHYRVSFVLCVPHHF